MVPPRHHRSLCRVPVWQIGLPAPDRLRRPSAVLSPQPGADRRPDLCRSHQDVQPWIFLNPRNFRWVNQCPESPQLNMAPRRRGRWPSHQFCRWPTGRRVVTLLPAEMKKPVSPSLDSGDLIGLTLPPPPPISPECRAQKWPRATNKEFVQCRTHNASCPHRLNCGGFNLCFHPGRKQIIARTKAAAKNRATSVA